MTRTFLALELPDAVKGALRRRIERLARAIPEVRWVDPASLHLTLAFLGELDDAHLEAATQAAMVIAKRSRAIHAATGEARNIWFRAFPASHLGWACWRAGATAGAAGCSHGRSRGARISSRRASLCSPPDAGAHQDAALG